MTQQVEDKNHEGSTSSMATTRMVTTHRPTYAMARAILHGKKVASVEPLFVLLPDPQFLCYSLLWMATAMRASTYQKQWQECVIRPWHISVYALQSTWCARPVCSIHESCLHGVIINRLRSRLN